MRLYCQLCGHQLFTIFSESEEQAPLPRAPDQTLHDTIAPVMPFATSGPSTRTNPAPAKKKELCGICGTGFQLKRMKHVICSLCNVYYHKKHPEVRMSFEEGVTSYVCHKCNPTGPPSSHHQARAPRPRFNALEGLPGHTPALPSSDQGIEAQMSACSPARDHGPAPGPGTQMGTVSITDNGDMVYRDPDLERLLVEAEEQETESLVTWARDVVEKATVLPSYSDYWPQFDARMNQLGFVRDPSQEFTPPNGDCALEAITAQVSRHFLT